ncbi:bifunctional aminoglycoside phosphotransferase/ATP-binding protein [Pseudovibrio exalbescens]|uniref:Aminoglycoside phosphotransferase n=1 Tax=Pseudovibrio exalbescens TaxID=197461 RepID=A0A1U7JCI4_9HYPH|nr:bifunctional aminoglycoside phosphotransferase/ATP-binding protein [Pseudovibrio exalbescens]OKL42415.1 aminoglycoside phosphotransferase [Pseudovibrio exalbescens]
MSDPHTVHDQSEAFSLMEKPETHGVSDVKRIDTHANVVFLAGEHAYKMKRAVKFPFLDYSTLDKREHACQREVELNRQYAPEIYLGVVPLTREEDGQLTLNGQGTPEEWAVHMVRFDEELGLDQICDHQGINDPLAEELARLMATAHKAAKPSDHERWIADLRNYVEQNRSAFEEFPAFFPKELAKDLSERAEKEHSRIAPFLRARGEKGYIRLTHGDAHLSNIVLIDNKPKLFDAVEFDDIIATGDILYDLAYLLLDLWEHDEMRAANRVLNRYLVATHDPYDLEALTCLPFFMMMRASIRAKIAASASLHKQGSEKARSEAQAQRYFRIACEALEPVQPQVIGVGGFSGTGKTTIARGLAPFIGRLPGAIHLRTDVERKLLLGLNETERAPAETYTKEVSNAVYDQVLTKAKTVLQTGHSVVVDGVFADPSERQALEDIARSTDASFSGLWLEAPQDIKSTRVTERRNDASDATADVVSRQNDMDPGLVSWTRLQTDADAVTVQLQALDLVL